MHLYKDSLFKASLRHLLDNKALGVDWSVALGVHTREIHRRFQ